MGAPRDCPDEGRLRAYLDGQGPQPAEAEAHLSGCPDCRARLEDLRRTAATVSAALDAPPAPMPGVDAAWDRFQARAAADPAGSPLWRLRQMWQSLYLRSRRQLMAAAVLAALIAGVAFVPPLRTAAGQFLDSFRVRAIHVVAFDPAQARGLDRKLFREVLVDEAEPQPVADAEEASVLAGRPVLVPAYVGSGFERVSFTVTGMRLARAGVDLAAARALLEASGLPTDVLPDDPDDARLTATIPPVVQIGYSQGTASYMVLQVASPELAIPEGMDLERVGEVGLQLLGFAPDEARRLSGSIDWATTLVVPVPQGRVSATEVMVGGVAGYALEGLDEDGYRENLVLWQSGGVVYAVSGNVDTAVLLRVAESLR